MSAGKSARKVQYDVRPCKQVERRMLIDAFQRLMQDGFKIRDYQYTGMGSIHFVDFVLMHRYLGIRRMLSVEMDTTLEKSVRFNCPYGCITTKMGIIGDEISSLSRDRKHILWLDYDSVMERSFTEDAMLAAQVLSPGSILLVTVDVEPPGRSPEMPEPADWRTYYIDQVGSFLNEPTTPSDFAKIKLPRLNADILLKAIKRGLHGRADISFEVMFHFLYTDSHKMLTLGGMIASPMDRRHLRKSSVAECDYYRNSVESGPVEITVPVVTRRERLYLDQFMPCSDDTWLPKDFELSEDEVRAYRLVYRYLPTYAELAF